MEHMVIQDRIMEEMCVNSALRDRRIFLNEEIDRSSIFKLVYWLDKLEALDKKMGTKEPIEIVIDSYGGSVYHTLSAISKMRSMVANGYEIITTCHSTAFSGAFMILIAGSKRRAFKNSRLMVHNISFGTIGKHQDIIEDLEETELLWIRLKDIIKETTAIEEARLEEIKKMKYDWYFWGDEALEYKIVDELI